MVRFSTGAFRPVLWSTQPPINCVQGPLSTGEEWQKLVARSPLSSAACSHVSAALHGLMGCRDETYAIRIISGT